MKVIKDLNITIPEPGDFGNEINPLIFRSHILIHRTFEVTSSKNKSRLYLLDRENNLNEVFKIEIDRDEYIDIYFDSERGKSFHINNNISVEGLYMTYGSFTYHGATLAIFPILIEE